MNSTFFLNAHYNMILEKMWMVNIVKIDEKIIFDKHHRCTAKFIYGNVKIKKENISK